MDTIQLKNDNIYRVFIYTPEIKDDNGKVLFESKPTGEYLEFDLEDIELPFIYQEIIEKLKMSRNKIKNKFAIIDKQQDHKGKKLMSSNEEAKLKAMNEFYKEQTEIYNMFLGENGVQKLLNGRKLRWTTLSEIDEIIKNTIAPKLDITLDNITNKIKNKYSKSRKDNVLE